MRRLFAVIVLVPSLLIADEVTESRRLQREAVAAYKAKDFAQFLEKSRASAELRPGHSGLQYNYAAGLALNGRGEEALVVLERVAAMGMVLQPAADDDFAALRDLPRFKAIVEQFGRNGSAIGTATRAFTVEERGIIPEGLASDGRSFFVGSVRNRVIYRVGGSGPPARFASLPFGVFGMAVDPKRNVLWAATSATGQTEGMKGDRAAVAKIDLRSGKILKTLDAPAGVHLFGDLTVAPNGDVYVSDSRSPTIFRIRGDVLQPFIENGPFSSLQGLALRGDTLYAADYSRGIFAIDLRTRDAHTLLTPSDVSLLGVDGIYAVPGGLVATQNGTNPQRVISIGIEGLRVISVKPLLSKHPDFDDVTLGAVAGRSFYVNATGQWERFTEDGRVKDESALRNAVVLKVDLGQR
jgi:hypothetical protein